MGRKGCGRQVGGRGPGVSVGKGSGIQDFAGAPYRDPEMLLLE